jgi:hypothetical protein
MATKVVLHGPGNDRTVEPLTPDEQADYDARLADAPNVEAAAQAQRANGDTLRARARQALAANAAFLGLPPAQQQVQAVAQTVRLTQQVTALIRLAIGALDSTAGS